MWYTDGFKIYFQNYVTQAVMTSKLEFLEIELLQFAVVSANSVAFCRHNKLVLIFSVWFRMGGFLWLPIVQPILQEFAAYLELLEEERDETGLRAIAIAIMAMH